MKALFVSFILICFICPNISFGKTSISSVDGLRLRLVPTSEDPVNGIGPKSITIRKEGPIIHTRWYSQAVDQVSTEPWPEFKVNLVRGIMKAYSWDNGRHFAHPHLWRAGLTTFPDNMNILWTPSTFVMQRVTNYKNAYIFEPGFLKPPFNEYKDGPQEIIKTVAEFRTLVQLMRSRGVDLIPNVDKKEKKKLTRFIERYDRVIHKGTQDYSMAINGKRDNVSTLIYGNDYISYIVLNDAENPLILGIDFYPDEVPETLRHFFEFFQKKMEYRITQAKYETKNPD